MVSPTPRAPPTLKPLGHFGQLEERDGRCLVGGLKNQVFGEIAVLARILSDRLHLAGQRRLCVEVRQDYLDIGRFADAEERSRCVVSPGKRAKGGT